MPRIRFSVRSLPAVLALVAAIATFASQWLPGDGPIVTKRLSRTYDTTTPLEVWEIDDPALPAHGVNDNWFADLVPELYASDAHTLPRGGTVIGRYTGGDPFARRHLDWLIRNGYPNANQHIVARVALTKEADDTDGRWFCLVSEDDYWTVTHYRDVYDFVVHVDHNGVVRLMNPQYYR